MLASELPVYRDTFEIVSLLMDYVAIFPKSHKYTIGQKITNVSLELFEYLQLANRAADNKAARVFDKVVCKNEYKTCNILKRKSKDRIIFKTDNYDTDKRIENEVQTA